MTSIRDDAVLIKRFQLGEREAFDSLIHCHQEVAYKYALRLTSNKDAAGDVVAEAFLRVYRSLDGFKGESSFKTWLYRIITNCYFDIRKKAASRPTVSLDAQFELGDSEVEVQFVDPSDSPGEEIERKERITRINEAIRTLPPYQKALVLMFHVESMSYEEIAATLDIPIGTVKSRLNRARLTLKNRLSSDSLFAAA
jgi:RNA polymerase sigma-70 factor (ECF subfamily)